MLILAGAFLWPVWARSHAKSDGERQALAWRFAQECLRMSMYGSMRSARFPEVAARLGTRPDKKARIRAAGS